MVSVVFKNRFMIILADSFIESLLMCFNKYNSLKG